MPCLRIQDLPTNELTNTVLVVKLTFDKDVGSLTRATEAVGAIGCLLPQT